MRDCTWPSNRNIADPTTKGILGILQGGAPSCLMDFDVFSMIILIYYPYMYIYIYVYVRTALYLSNYWKLYIFLTLIYKYYSYKSNLLTYINYTNYRYSLLLLKSFICIGTTAPPLGESESEDTLPLPEQPLRYFLWLEGWQKLVNSNFTMAYGRDIEGGAPQSLN